MNYYLVYFIKTFQLLFLSRLFFFSDALNEIWPQVFFAHSSILFVWDYILTLLIILITVKLFHIQRMPIYFLIYCFGDSHKSAHITPDCILNTCHNFPQKVLLLLCEGSIGTWSKAAHRAGSLIIVKIYLIEIVNFRLLIARYRVK